MTQTNTARFSRVPLIPAAQRLGQEALRVLIALGRYADPDGRAWPSMATLSRDTGIKPQNVARAIRKLEAAGLLRRHRVLSKERGWQNNVYTLIFDAAEPAHPDTSDAGRASGHVAAPEPDPAPDPIINSDTTPPIIPGDYLTAQRPLHSGESQDLGETLPRVRARGHAGAREGRATDDWDEAGPNNWNDDPVPQKAPRQQPHPSEWPTASGRRAPDAGKPGHHYPAAQPAHPLSGDPGGIASRPRIDSRALRRGLAA